MSKTDYINILQGCSSTLRNDYGIKSLRLFGSVARGEDHEGSDVDVFVETETPNPFLLMDAKDFLERLVGRSVDIIRNHKNLNPRLRSRIERDGVAVFWKQSIIDIDVGQIFWILSNELTPLQTALQHFINELSE